MPSIRRASERGLVNMGWLHSQHTFSFGHYYDPKHMGFSMLRVINDDTVAPGMGFDTHAHRDMEIISYVIQGALEHKDSRGNHHIIPAGDVQLMSAGTGITHSEYNYSATEQTRFLQIWIRPDVKGLSPSYAQANIEQDGPLTPLVTPNGQQGSLVIHQDASLHRLKLSEGETYTLNTHNRWGYLHLVEGSAQTAEIRLEPGDAIGLTAHESFTVEATAPLEALWFELPPG
ncbi:pirin family protein [Pseudoalteromonas rubra]|uniref:Pirin family protein n=1 Tax=Pseudoalteromonas rubra TaxID=43658 RepID=A0A5S3WFE8_9GAMM|nr:pirin family protein [Pseudoalteromonas rubra]TMP24371.1 pirin family protein [Pseudoalteromonas rubra]TMP30860.1 pirin family protein [Pseudoalteromonas rubra]